MMHLAGETTSQIVAQSSTQEYRDDVRLVLKAAVTRGFLHAPRLPKTPRLRRALRRAEELSDKWLTKHQLRQRGRKANAIDDILELHRADPMFLPECDLPLTALLPLFAGRRRVQECLCDDGRLRLDPDGDAHDQIEAVFGPIYATNIPEFLDWHYTVVGQYTELAMAAAGRLEQEIDSRLFGNLTEQVELASGAIATMQESEARALLAQCIESEVQLLDADRETRELRVRMLNEAIGDALRRLAASAGVSGSGAVGAGVAGGLLVKAIVKKLLASIAVKTTGKSAVKAVGSWKGAAAVAAALSPLGPVGTVVGGVLGAAGGWLVVDRLAVEVDEFLNRDDLERELVALTDERRAETAAAMSAAIEARARAFDAMCLPRAFDEPESEPLGPFTPSELGDRR
jgi:hypothetical protein